MINKVKLQHYQSISRLKKYLFLILIMTTLFLVSYFILGSILYSILISSLPILLALKVHPQTEEIIKLTSADFVNDQNNPLLINMVRKLAKRAHLSSCPKSYLIGTNHINAFTSGEGDDLIICVTEGVLDKLGPNELEAVLAHEIAHLKENDMFYLKLLQIIYGLTAFLSTFIHLTLLISIPFILIGMIKVNILPVIIILLAPNFIRLLIMAFMRNREFAADENAVALTKDPKSLACALKKLTSHNMSIIDLIFPKKEAFKITNIFETHPSPEQRIKKLIELDF